MFKAALNKLVLIEGRVSGKTKSGQAPRQLYNDTEELPMLERASPLPEDEAICDPHSGLGTRISCKKVCINLPCDVNSFCPSCC